MPRGRVFDHPAMRASTAIPNSPASPARSRLVTLCNLLVLHTCSRLHCRCRRAGWTRCTQFSEPTRTWFAAAFAEPTPAQAGAWDAIAAGRHALVVAPTGSGKTLSAFLWSIDRLLTEPAPDDKTKRCRVLYISPLKALAVDVERNLRAPLVGIRQTADRLGVDRARDHASASAPATPPRPTGAGWPTHPPDILITTPESLFLMLTCQAREALRGVETVIVDEVHAVAGTKRGAHLAVSPRAARRAARRSRPSGSACPRRSARSTRSPGSSAARAPVEIVAPPAREGVGPQGRRAGRGHDRPRGVRRGVRRPAPRSTVDLAARRGARRRPDRAAPLAPSSSPTRGGSPSG